MAYTLNLPTITILATVWFSGGGTAHESDPTRPEYGRLYESGLGYVEVKDPFVEMRDRRGGEWLLLYAGPRDRRPRQPGGRCCIFTCICINPWLVQFG